jgi:hypothetical protein
MFVPRKKENFFQNWNQLRVGGVVQVIENLPSKFQGPEFSTPVLKKKGANPNAWHLNN